MISDAYKTMIAVILIKFATSFTNDWGVISIYIFSYFHYKGAPFNMDASTNSIMLILTVIPVVIAFIISTKIATKIGYVKLVKISALGYMCFPLLTFIHFDFITFFLFNMLAPCVFFTFSFVPTFSCLYSHFGNGKSLATAVVIGSFSIGAVVWNLIVTLAINPDNLIPDVATQDPHFKYFPQQMTERVPITIHLVYIVSGLMFILGSLLISYNEDYVDKPAHSLQTSQKGEQLKQQQKLSPSICEQENKQTEPIEALASNPLTISEICFYLRHPIVILVFLLNIFSGVYQVYIQLNTKIIYMPILQDDHLISLGLMIIILSSALFSIPWGYLADRKGPFFAILVFVMLDLAFKLYAALDKSKAGFLIGMALVGATDKTMFVLFAPIMIDAFGLKVTTQLLFLKGVSGIFSVIITSIIGIIISSMSTDKALLWMCIFSIINIGLGVSLANLIKKFHHKSKLQLQKQ